MMEKQVLQMIGLKRQIRREKDKMGKISETQSQDRDFYKNVFENSFLRDCLRRKMEAKAQKLPVRAMKSNKKLSKSLTGYFHTKVVGKRTQKQLAPTPSEKTFNRLVSKLLPEVAVVLGPVLAMETPTRHLPLREKVANW